MASAAASMTRVESQPKVLSTGPAVNSPISFRLLTTYIIANIIGVITLVLGASGVVVEVQDALDVVWDAEQRTASGIWQAIRTRLLSLAMLLALVFLLLVSLVVSAGLSAINTYTSSIAPALAYLVQFANLLFDVALLAVLFAIIFKYLPRAQVRWRDVRVGAIITSVLFLLGQFVITLYLGKMNATSPYGDAGALIIVLLWVYYSAQLLLLGAEFTNTWSKRGRTQRSRPQSTAAAS